MGEFGCEPGFTFNRERRTESESESEFVRTMKIDKQIDESDGFDLLLGLTLI